MHMSSLVGGVKMSTTTQSNTAVNDNVKCFSFTLVLSGVDELTDEVANDLFEAGCNDASPYMRASTLYLGFDRDEVSLSAAIESAIEDVEKAGLEVVRVVPPDGDIIDLVNEMLKMKRIISRQFSKSPGETPDHDRFFKSVTDALLRQLKDEEKSG